MKQSKKEKDRDMMYSGVWDIISTIDSNKWEFSTNQIKFIYSVCYCMHNLLCSHDNELKKTIDSMLSDHNDFLTDKERSDMLKALKKLVYKDKDMISSTTYGAKKNEILS